MNSHDRVPPRPLASVGSLASFATGYTLGDVARDGNCLFSAICSCLQPAGLITTDPATLRRTFCTYLRDHIDAHGGGLRAAVYEAARDGFTYGPDGQQFALRDPSDLHDYININERPLVWADVGLMLPVAAAALSLPILVLDWSDAMRVPANAAVHGRLYMPPPWAAWNPTSDPHPLVIRQVPNHFQPLLRMGPTNCQDGLHRLALSHAMPTAGLIAATLLPPPPPPLSHRLPLPPPPLPPPPPPPLQTSELAATWTARASASPTGGGYCPDPCCNRRFHRLRQGGKANTTAPQFKETAVSLPFLSLTDYAAHRLRVHNDAATSVAPAFFPSHADPIPDCKIARSVAQLAAARRPTTASTIQEQRSALAARRAIANSQPISGPCRPTAASFFQSEPPVADSDADDSPPAPAAAAAAPSHRPTPSRHRKCGSGRGSTSSTPHPRSSSAPARGSLLLLPSATPLQPDPQPRRHSSDRPTVADYALIAALDMAAFTRPDSVPIHQHCPHSLNHLFTRCLLPILHGCASPTADTCVVNFRLLHLLPRMLFAGLPRGTSLPDTSRRNAALGDRMCRFISGDFRPLLEEHVARADAANIDRAAAAAADAASAAAATAAVADLHSTIATKIASSLRGRARRAEALTRCGELSRAGARLASDAVPAPACAASLAALRPKHPPRRWAIPPDLLRPDPAPAAIQLTTDSVLQAIKRAPRAAAAGCDGWVTDHIRYAVLDDPGLLHAITSACQVFADGKLPDDAISFFGAGRLLGLTKPDSQDLRPICVHRLCLPPPC